MHHAFNVKRFMFLTELNLIVQILRNFIYTADYTANSKSAIAVSLIKLVKSFVMHREKRILFQT